MAPLEKFLEPTLSVLKDAKHNNRLEQEIHLNLHTTQSSMVNVIVIYL